MARDEDKRTVSKPLPITGSAEANPKAARLAQALRDNLKRRKDQARGRDRAVPAGEPKGMADQ